MATILDRDTMAVDIGLLTAAYFDPNTTQVLRRINFIHTILGVVQVKDKRPEEQLILVELTNPQQIIEHVKNHLTEEHAIFRLFFTWLNRGTTS